MSISFESLKQYQRHFKRLIELERQEEISFHLNEINSMSGFSREKKGRALMAMVAKEFGRGIGGVHLVKLARNDALPDTEISIGDLVILSKGKPEGNESQATVIDKTKFSITVAYNNAPPGYISKNKVRLDLFANDITFQRMQNALNQLPAYEKLSGLLLTKNKPHIEDCSSGVDFQQKQLNRHQQEAVIDSLNARDYFLIHGPPGTGKTTTLISSIIQHVRKGQKVLATADSNTAVDNMVEKLVDLKVDVVRIGNPARINPEISKVSIDYIVQDDADYQNAIAMRDVASELKQEQKQYFKPSGQARRGLSDDEILKLSRRGGTNRGIPISKIHRMAEWINMQRQISALQDQSRKLEKKAVKRIIEKADVICATNSTSGSELLHNVLFDLVVVDEATQAMEPSCLIPMAKGGKWILAGDHKQLPPTILSRDAEMLNFTLFERWTSLANEHVKSMLKIQYRMHEDIMSFSNKSFYNGALVASPKVKNHHIATLSGFEIPEFISREMKAILNPEHAICFVDIIHGEEKKIRDSFSYYNKHEADLAVEIADSFMHCRLFPEDLGIISPYEQQVNNIKSQLRGSGIEIKTVDGFQGREKEIIIISLVRANEQE